MATALQRLFPLSTPSPPRSRRSSLRSPSRSRDISIVLCQGGTCCDVKLFNSEEGLRDVKLRLQNKQCFLTTGRELVFGERRPPDKEKIPASISEGEEFLHIYVRASDIREAEANFCDVDVSKLQSILPLAPRRSNLHSALTSSFPQDGSSKSTPPLTTKSLALPEQDRPGTDELVVHIMVRRQTHKVDCRYLKGGSQIELSVSPTALSPASQAVPIDPEARRTSLSRFADNRLAGAWPASRSLAEYGGAGVLDLNPIPPLTTANVSLGSSPQLDSPAHELYSNWKKACAGLACGQPPTLASAGSGGSYFIKDDTGKNVAVFKPEDEEQFAVNNPRGRRLGEHKDSLKRGVLPGEGAAREVAAFLLDHGRFSGVPPTELVEFGLSTDTGASTREIKRGSLQQFVASNGDCEEFGNGLFSVREVHRICVLDLRMGNTDRNGGNILVRKTEQGWELTPIDHGYCLPSCFQDISFEWTWWSQAREPFDEATREYIRRLDAARDLHLLSAHGISLRPECARVFRVCTMVLQKAAARGLTPFAIAAIICREGAGKNKSPIEKLHSRATSLCKCAAPSTASADKLEDDGYLKCMGVLLDEYFEETLLDDVLA